MQVATFLSAALCNLNVKDTPKIQKTLQERRWMRGFEKTREALKHRTSASIN
jgi:hypothetical protein